MSMSISSDKTVPIKILKSRKNGYQVMDKKDITEIYTVMQETQRDSDKRIASPFQIWNFNEISWGEITVVRCQALVSVYHLGTLHSFPRPLENFLGHLEVKTS